MVTGLCIKLKQFGDKVHLADELIPTFAGAFACVTIYCEYVLKKIE